MVDAKSDISRLVWPDEKSQRYLPWLDRVEDIANAALYGGVAYTGFQAMQHPSGALLGILGLKLAQAPNILAGGVGTAMLAMIGMNAGGFWNPEKYSPENVAQATADFKDRLESEEQAGRYIPPRVWSDIRFAEQLTEDWGVNPYFDVHTQAGGFR